MSDDAGFPRTTAALKAVLAAHGIRPQKRKHGQCFLTDPQAVDAVVRDAGVRAADRVIEVGTGSGLLTHALCETGAEVVTFDVDADIQRIARSLRDWPARVTFEHGDVLQGKHAFAPAFQAALEAPSAASGQRLMVSNLPYSAATPILMGLLSMASPPDRIVVMIQREVAEKMVARPGPSNYGVPSIQVGLKAEARILRRFGPGVFWPRPKVDSAVIEFVPRRPASLGPDEQRPFGTFVTTLFTRRRKVLGTALAHAGGCSTAEARRVVEVLGLGATVRVQALAPTQVLALFRAVRRLST